MSDAGQFGASSPPPGALADTTATEQAKLELATKYSRNAYMLVAAGVVGLFFFRNVALAADRLARNYRRRRHVRPLGGKTTIPQPYLTKQILKFDRLLGRPVGVWPVPAHWTFTQLVLTTLILACNLTACLVLDVRIMNGAQLHSSQFIAIRAGNMAATNLPFLYALAGRNSVVGLLTGFSYQTVRAYHKLLGILVFVEVLVHATTYSVYWVNVTGSLHGYRLAEWDSPDHFLHFGVAAIASLFVCVLVALPFIRRRAYELFLLTHVAGAAVFLAGAWYHRQNNVYGWIYAAAAVWGAERLYRLTRFVGTRFGLHKPIISNATAEVIHGAIKLRVPMGHQTWEAGQHCYISFWGTALLRRPWLYGQSHPFTVSNCPGPGGNEMEFIIRIHDGLTKTLAQVIEKTGRPYVKLPVAVEGTYGARPRVEKYDSVLLVAGGSGITHLASVLSEMARRPRDYAATKEVKLVWAIHHLNQAQWIAPLLREARASARATGLGLELELYITREEAYSARARTRPRPQSEAEKYKQSTVEVGNPVIGAEDIGSPILHFARPDVAAIVGSFLGQAIDGERSAVLACGPGELGDAVRAEGARVAKVGDLVQVASFEG